MRKLVLFVVILCYFGAGASIGSILFDLAHGRSDKVVHDYGTLALAVVGNAALLPYLLYLWRRRHSEAEITLQSSEMRLPRIFLHGLPLNKRIAFLLFSTGWLIGFLVPIAFGF